MIDDGSIRIDRGLFEARVAAAACHAALREGDVVALQADNGIDWLVAAAAVKRARAVLLPLPGFFTEAQCRHALDATGATLLLSDGAARGGSFREDVQDGLPGTGLRVFHRQGGGGARTGFRAVAAGDPQLPVVPAGTGLITFTSGSTGVPRGVCLGHDALDAVATGVAEVAEALGIERHLCLLPLAVLLEQVAGVGAAERVGATILALPLVSAGLSGSSRFDPARALAAMNHHSVNSVILLPQMLQALVDAVSAGAPVPRSLRLVAVGGGHVPVALVARARTLGIPACEGYGLSECGSVVALALPSDPPGAGMRPLSHVRVHVETLHEDRQAAQIVVDGPSFLGYLDAPAQTATIPRAVHTGDLGSIDAAGRLRITGRLKNLLITGFGRNVSPEWPESALLAQPEIRQAAVFGDGRPWLSAVLVPDADVGPGDHAAIAAAVGRANATLPDYARIEGWVIAAAPFTAGDGQLTANGRLRREAILMRHEQGLHALYQRLQLEIHDGLP
jgi:long-chain acyl-CoA synthetase